MQALVLIAGSALSLAACGQPAEKAAPTPAEAVSAMPVTSDAHAAAPTGLLTAADLRRVCRAGLASIHGQDVGAVQIDSVEGSVVNASWRAPVDGGRMKAQCRVEGDVITYKPVDRPVAEQNRWMNQSGDPVVRFVLDAARITVTTTLPDGTTSTDDYPVAASVEAK